MTLEKIAKLVGRKRPIIADLCSAIYDLALEDAAKEMQRKFGEKEAEAVLALKLTKAKSTLPLQNQA